MARNRRHQFWGIGKLQFWSLGKLRLSNFSLLFSLLPLLIGGLFTVVTESKAEARHKSRPTEECCVVVAQTFPPGYEYGESFPDRFVDRTYEVFVPTYSEDLLYFVQRRVDRRAQPTNRRGRTVITLGRYDLAGARKRVRQLMQHGITSEMVANSNSFGNSVLPWEDSRYVVFVSVGSRTYLEDLLFRVQAVVPEASVWQYQGKNVILVGQFADRSEALQFRNQLRRQGIRAQFARNSVRPVVQRIPRNETNFVALENPNQSRFVALENQVQVVDPYTASNSYTVIIPVRREELAAIEAQVREMAINMGVQDEILIQYDADRPQLIVGPFSQLEAAQDWERYLEEYGIMNARVVNRN